MRILLVLDRVENAASANALMGFRLAEQLLARDYTVHILTLWDGLHNPPAPPQGAGNKDFQVLFFFLQVFVQQLVV